MTSLRLVLSPYIYFYVLLANSIILNVVPLNLIEYLCPQHEVELYFTPARSGLFDGRMVWRELRLNKAKL